LTELSLSWIRMDQARFKLLISQMSMTVQEIQRLLKAGRLMIKSSMSSLTHLIVSVETKMVLSPNKNGMVITLTLV
jgi:hypothetical protein